MKILFENWRRYLNEEKLVDVYHVTSYNNLDKVLKNGIASSGGDFGEGIYVWLTKEGAIKQINSGEGWAFDLENPVIVEAKVSKSDIWQPKLEDILHTLELDSEEDLDLDDEEYYMSMGVIRQSTPVVNITNVFNEKGDVQLISEASPAVQQMRDRIAKHQGKQPSKAKSGEEVAKELGYEVKNKKYDIVTFDFDDTLTITRPDEDWGVVEVGPNDKIISAMRGFISKGAKVYIVTSRYPDRLGYSVEGAPERSTPEQYVEKYGLNLAADPIYTSGKLKAETLTQLGSKLHFDDDIEELQACEEVGIETIKVDVPHWNDINEQYDLFINKKLNERQFIKRAIRYIYRDD